MPEYCVKWEIDIIADTPLKAALEAQEIQRDLESTATFFELIDNTSGEKFAVDLETNEIV